MDYCDRFLPIEKNDYDSVNDKMDALKSTDRGYSFVYRDVLRKNGQLKKTKIDIYATGDFGSNIRDATSGNVYPYKVGTLDEYLFFKVGLSTGECKSKNGSNSLFYLSPEQYEKHLHGTVSDSLKEVWLKRRDEYLGKPVVSSAEPVIVK
jgi:hypothetical protein